MLDQSDIATKPHTATMSETEESRPVAAPAEAKSAARKKTASHC